MRSVFGEMNTFEMLGFTFPKLGQIGAGIGVGIFLSTLSFLFTTPGSFGMVDGMFVPKSGFILKDVVLLGVCLMFLSPRAYIKD